MFLFFFYVLQIAIEIIGKKLCFIYTWVFVHNYILYYINFTFYIDIKDLIELILTEDCLLYGKQILDVVLIYIFLNFNINSHMHS